MTTTLDRPLSTPATPKALTPELPSEPTVGDALEAHYGRTGFGPEDYQAAWAKADFGPITVVFPNWAARGRTLSLHDPHHAITGYTTDLLGEAELGAYELAAGCHKHWVAWYLQHSIVTMAFLAAPRAIYAAFMRGRGGKTYYDLPEATPELFERSLAAERVAFGMEGDPPKATPKDLALFALLVVTSAFHALLALPLLPLFALLWAAYWVAYRVSGAETGR